MATDSTELTFVRCPSCRSLVPAVSTRCRMCGAGLDASGEGEDLDKDQKKSGRVRQRTMSQSQSELNAAVGKLRAAEGLAPGAAPEAPRAPVAAPVQTAPVTEAEEIVDAGDDASLEDPLSAYIEEVDESDGAKPADKPSVERNGNSVHKAATPPAFMEEEEPEKAATPPPAAAKTAPPPVEAPPARREPEANRSEESQQRVIVEQGVRRQGKPSGLSFSRGREERQQEEAPRHSKPEPRQEQRVEKSERADAVSFSREERRERAPQPQQARHQEERHERPERNERSERNERQERPVAPARPAENVRKADVQPGRLFGWLVSYSDPDGNATELREGKFFVTASSLKQSDLIIEDSSISTPHALISVSVEGGMQVQDLMSDRGVFVRRRGDDTYRREADVARVEHGDWLRFGDVEFLVSLIAHVGVK